MKQFDLSGFSSAEMAREPDSQAHYLRSGRRVFPSRRGFHRCGQAAVGLACQALGAQELAVLDQIAPALPLARAVFSSSDHLGTGYILFWDKRQMYGRAKLDLL